MYIYVYVGVYDRLLLQLVIPQLHFSIEIKKNTKK